LLAELQVKKFILQIDESTLRDNVALLMIQVRFLNGDQLKEEMLFARKLKIGTKGETIFEEVKSYVKENNIRLQDITACATDGAVSMVGGYRRFIAHLTNAVLEVFVYTA
jgi:hypothetical protein